MGVLLTLISFPKVVALVAIYTLAVADPLSAIIGIKYGKTKIVKGKSLEGSLAFFTASLIITFSYSFGGQVICKLCWEVSSSSVFLWPLLAAFLR
jgi:dolichol kinase